jgi:hypothetical protein
MDFATMVHATDRLTGGYPMAITSESIGATGSIKCPAPVVSHLTPVQQAALHMFKHQCLAALYELYMVVPPKQANPIIEKFLPTLTNGKSAD